MKINLKGKIFDIISGIADQNNTRVYVIGGFVRDLLLKRTSKDIDFVVLGSGIDFAKIVAQKLSNNVSVTYFKNFGTAQIVYKSFIYEFVGARKESYRRNSRKPIVENGTLEDDQNRRDFTINALAISLNKEDYGTLLDPFNGVQDIENCIIRTPLNPDITFSDDPLRMMRAIRFATQLNFKIHDVTFKAIIENKNRIEIVSKERIIDELNKIVISKKPSTGFTLLFNTGLLELIFPEMYNLHGVDSIDNVNHKDNFWHTLKVLDNISEKTDNIWLRWAAILHDIGKPATKKFVDNAWTFHNHQIIGANMVPKIFYNLRLPLNDKMKYVKKLVENHHRPISLATETITDSAVRRLIFDMGEDINDLMILAESDITTQFEQKQKRFLENFKILRQKIDNVNQNDFIRNWQPPINGIDIMKIFNLPPSKVVGELKNAVKDAILDGVIPNNYDDAYKFLIEQAEKYELKPKN